jgi:hypothetical protein
MLKDIIRYFEYNPESVSCIKRSVDIYSGKRYTTLSAKAGVDCGFLRDNYWVVKLKQKAIFVHKIVWAIHNLEYGDFEVDHINGNSLDNRIENLRKVPHITNCQNRKIRKDNSTGITGVSVSKNGYRARWFCNSKHYEKRFTGIDALESAIVYREDMIKKLNLEGQNYTDRHGT